jgi:hypothetical protein
MSYQNVITSLERYKRRLGRQYNRAVALEQAEAGKIAEEYNNVEDQIAALVTLHGLTRTSKAYKLEVNNE